jgi:hypothetical protein
MSMDTVPDQCQCGGRLEYDGEKQGIEFYRCAVEVCRRVYHRFIDSIGG